ncbi:hypothetical protein BJF80_11675 [Serinicoccus sp. CUA-874]|uniref:hypothetical protein n=1 Tax=Serinicoccus sp. CUA-874 TaxID=1517939 RepID=UPI0009628A40|nr:hypothetical protein [Serinicoccus sp. CUA-874]OLT15013.1 hypothetical protein BJF80_11675 [Serinicoccus sp. CUA-874]
MTDEVDVRGLLEGASRIDGDERVVPDAPWGAGRRRRTRKRVGGGVASALATVAAGALVWQTGVLGGGDGLDGVAAEFPPGGTTFVFADAATPSAQTPDPAALSAVTPVDAGELTGTRWTLQEDLWRGGDSAEVVGADAATELAFPAVGGGWGVSVDGCGQAMATGALRLEPDGAFAPQELMTTDLGCPAQVQAAEDFWMEALAGGGSLHRLGDEQAGLLLLTVVAPTTDEPVAATTPERPAPTSRVRTPPALTPTRPVRSPTPPAQRRSRTRPGPPRWSRRRTPRTQRTPSRSRSRRRRNRRRRRPSPSPRSPSPGRSLPSSTRAPGSTRAAGQGPSSRGPTPSCGPRAGEAWPPAARSTPRRCGPVATTASTASSWTSPGRARRPVRAGWRPTRPRRPAAGQVCRRGWRGTACYSS